MIVLTPSLEVQLTKLIQEGRFKELMEKLKSFSQTNSKGLPREQIFETHYDLGGMIMGNSATVLHWVAYYGLSGLIPALLAKDRTLLNSQAIDVATPLIVALANRQFDAAEALIKEGANVNESTHHGITALHLAAQHGSTYLVALLLEKLLEQGGKIDARDKAGRTPLTLAVGYGKTNNANFLIAAGADHNLALRASLDYHEKPLSYELTKFPAIIPIFLRLGLDQTNQKSFDSAVSKARGDIFKTLIRALPFLLPIFSPEHMQVIADVITKAYIDSHAKQRILPGQEFLLTRPDVDKLIDTYLPQALDALFERYAKDLNNAARDLLKNPVETKKKRDVTADAKETKDTGPKTFLDLIAEGESKDTKDAIVDEKMLADKVSELKRNLPLIIKIYLMESYLKHEMLIVMGPFIQRALKNLNPEDANVQFLKLLPPSLIKMITKISFPSIDYTVQGFSSDPDSPFHHQNALATAKALEEIYNTITNQVLKEAGITSESKSDQTPKQEQKENKREHKQEPLLHQIKKLEEERKQKEKPKVEPKNPPNKP